MPTPSPIVSCSTSATALAEPRIPPSRSAAVTNAASASSVRIGTSTIVLPPVCRSGRIGVVTMTDGSVPRKGHQ